MSWLRQTLGLPGKPLIAERKRARTATPHPHPLFLFGNQKAGGSAIAGLMGAATGMRVSIDLPGATAPYIAPLLQGRTPLSRFIADNAYSFSAPIIKEGNLTFIAEELMAHFHVERAIFILRNPADNIRSILDRLKLRGDLARLDVSRTRANATWQDILSGADVGLGPDHYVANLARRWQLMAEIQERDPARFVRIRYEDFCADKLGEIQRLAAAFDLPAPHDISALLDRNFQRRGHAGTDLRAFFGPDNLNRITDICGESAARLGYTIG